METDQTIYTLAEYECIDGHEWYGLCILTGNMAAPIEQTEFCPICGMLNEMDAEDEDMPDFIPSDEMPAHRLKWDERNGELFPNRWYGTDTDYRNQP